MFISQLQALMDERLLSTVAIDFAKLMNSSDELSAMLLVFIEKITQSPNSGGMFNGTEFMNFFTKLGQLLSQQYTQQLTSW